MSGKMGAQEEEAYNLASSLLQCTTNLEPQLSSIPSLVSMRDIVREPPLEDEPPSTLLKSNHGHHALFRALEEIDKLDSEMLLEQDTLRKITCAVTNVPLESGEEALPALQALGMSIPRRVCQHPFRRNDIVWVCRTCQGDETCVLCHSCFTRSQHEGHDVAFYHAQAGGCCDCGDPDAWDPAGFCPDHGPSAHSGEGGLDAAIVNRVKGIVPATVDWLVKEIAANAQTAHQRANPSKPEMRREESDEDLFGDDDDDAMAVDLEHVFVPSAASTSKSRHGSLNTSVSSDMDSPGFTTRLGEEGLKGHGLYLILHADDIHTTSQIVDALRDHFGGSSYYTDSLLGRLARALRQTGQLVVWGTMEVVGVCSSSHVHCWLDGDKVAAGRIGAVLLGKATNLARHGLVCSIATRKELQFEQRAVAVLQWLTELARSCDPLCQTVAESILPEQHLMPMLRADFKLSAHITKAWHSLLLTLLAVPAFKSHLAAAYCDTYRHVTAEYASGMGVLERSSYTLSVQFLNRVTYVVGLVQERDLLGKLGKSLLETLSVAATTSKRLNPNHFVLTHRRYSPCISDLKCVLNIKGMARLFAASAGSFLQDWIESLSLAQFMDGIVWRTTGQGHVEVEPRGWVGAFNASISLGSLFERLLSWDDDDASPIDAAQSPLAQNLQSSVDLTFHAMTHGLAQWQSEEMLSYVSKAEKGTVAGEQCLCPASLPFSNVAARHGSHVAFNALPIAQVTPWSFHLPLHRFVAACLREVCRRPVDQSTGMDVLMERLSTQIPDVLRDSLFQGLMEFPALVLSRAAQIRAGLWKRNGGGMHDQVLNYAEPPFCRALRDADILLLQFAALGRNPHGEDMGCPLMIHLLLHRFGLYDFMGFEKAPNSNIVQYKEELALEVYNPETKTKDAMNYFESCDMVLPWTYTPAKDVPSSVALLEEFLHLLIVLITELPPLPPTDKAEHTSQAKQRLRREVVHRLASGPKTHSELAEVHHVLSHWDNVFLSEEGKLVNPDDATGAALGQALSEVAERKSSRGKLTPDQWVLNRTAWDDYDPAFFHISLRNHQSAAENRPKPATAKTPLGVEARPFAPSKQTPVHPTFQRLPRDVTADATVLAVAYRTLHVHCSNNPSLKSSLAYHSDAMSETALARAVHLLTLGALAWRDARANDKEWKKHGGASMGSIFYGRSLEASAPTALDWVAGALMSRPGELMDSEWYTDEENTLLLLRRLAVDGGISGAFISQDRALRSGAAWLCEFAAENNAEAASLIGAKAETASNDKSENSGKSEMEQRKQAAKARALERMKAEAARFAEKMKIEAEDDEDDTKLPVEDQALGMLQDEEMSSPLRTGAMSVSSTFSEHSVHSTSTAASRSPQRSDLGVPQFFSMYSSGGDVILDDSEKTTPDRLLKDRPQCIICVDDGPMVAPETEASVRGDSEEGNRKRSRRKTGSNALAFVGYAQASTVLKGGGGPPPAIDDYSQLAAVRRFAGTHVTLCGHAVHSECCESYLASVSHREDRSIGRRDEFRCPLCQRLSNCLVPFIDVGVDWTDVPNRSNEVGLAKSVNVDGSSDMMVISEQDQGASEAGSAAKASSTDSMVLDERGHCRFDLHEFLTTTPWWVARNDSSVVWDGQCAFISADAATDKGDMNESQDMDVDNRSPKMQRKRSVRSLRKKDLYTAWNAMMKTPRFMRRRLRSKTSSLSDDAAADPGIAAEPQWAPSEESSGETLVWRRLMDLLADTAFRADGKRLGEQYLLQYCGEFRHYTVEKSAHNIMNREVGKQSIEWPACISPTTLSDTRRQELSREKLLSKLLMSVQAFSYSCCCESREAKRLLRREAASRAEAAGLEQNSETLQSIYSTYGISGVACNGKLVLLPVPSTENEGTQPFNGRLGKLRYFGLAVMAAAGAVSADLVQLVLSFPVNTETPVSDDPLTMYFDHPSRAPVVFPLLLGHVLTHVVAAMCATCGRARARSDSLELAWPAPFSRRGSFCGPLREKETPTSSVVNDCEGFIKLGMLARMLQILLNRMGINAEEEPDTREVPILNTLRRMIEMDTMDTPTSKWSRACFLLLEMALSKTNVSGDAFGFDVVPAGDWNVEEQFLIACSVAACECVSFLSDIGMIFQLLVPGLVTALDVQDAAECGDSDTDLSLTLDTLGKLQDCLGLESVELMLQSSLVKDVARNWFETARSHARSSVGEETGMFHSIKVRSRLCQTEGFRSFDWPMESTRPYVDGAFDMRAPGPAGYVSARGAQLQDNSANTAGLLDSCPTTIAKHRPASSSPLVAFSSKKSVHLIGGYTMAASDSSSVQIRPRVPMLATSYTDLYATLGTLCPDSEQTALCLICGEVLNAGGKGECTRHSYKCGAGSCVFFLLQECVGLIMHGDKAAYVHSPYVDSHGETPQYRGRPLNLDLDRYNLLHELWSGHTVRQRVVAERGSSRQVIIADFY